MQKDYREDAVSFELKSRKGFSQLKASAYTAAVDSRRALMDLYDVSENTATRDLALYRKLAPANMVLDPTDHRYFRTANFSRVWP
jgi:hypothetical protein